MIQRYSRPEMRAIWTDENKLRIWLQIELLASEALVREGVVPRKDFAKIKAGCEKWLADLPARVERLSFRVICGPTGSGKTRLLHALAAAGAQVLDLEALARHRASVLGAIPGVSQPSQKHFETQVWDTVRALDAARPVYVEAESRKVGNLTLPESLVAAMRASACLRVDLSQDERVALLLEDYPFFVSNPAFFCERLDALVTLRGRAVVEGWKTQIAAGHTEAVVRELLEKHYDPGYATSTRRNFSQFEHALAVAPSDRSQAAFDRASAQILAAEAPVLR